MDIITCELSNTSFILSNEQILAEYVKTFPYVPINEINGIAKDDAIWYIIKKDSDLIGFFTLFKYNNSLILFNFAIFENHRNKKYGKVALNFITNNLLSHYKCDNICLFVKKNNQRAINFYLKNKFFKTKCMFKPANDEIVMKYD